MRLRPPVAASVVVVFAALTCVLVALSCRAQPDPAPAPPPARLGMAAGLGTPSLARSLTISTTWDGVTGAAPAGSTLTVEASDMGAATIVVTGSMTGALQFEATSDSTHWWAAPLVPIGGGAAVTSASAAGQWTWAPSGAQQFRVRCSSLVSGTPLVAVSASGNGTAALSIQGPVTIKAAAPVAPVVYLDAGTGTLTGDTGATWLLGPLTAVPSGAKSASFVVQYTGGGSGAQLSYRVRVSHYADAGAAGVTRILNNTPTISGSVATQTAYTGAVQLAETGSALVNVPISFDVSGGVAYVAMDVQEVASAVDAGVAVVSLAWSF